jgi:anaerobic magnesium-protoporphyrin IX monomethyl ester cyclase
MIDVLFISPSNSQEVYQDLSASYAAIEPPTWALLLAQAHLRREPF